MRNPNPTYSTLSGTNNVAISNQIRCI